MKHANIPIVEADADDLYLMLLLWQHQTTREAALDIADRNRRSTTPAPANAKDART